MNLKLRLLVTKKCYNKCSNCSNKNYDLNNLPIVEHYNYDEVIITGGDPLHEDCIEKTISLLSYLKLVIPDENRRVYLYTATPSRIHVIINLVDDVTLTLHNQKDAFEFSTYSQTWSLNLNEKTLTQEKSLRLHVFKGITIAPHTNTSHWKIKNDLVWIKNCPLPENEVFMRLSNI